MSRVLSGKLRKAGRRVGSVSSVWSTTAGGHRDTQGWKPRALFIQQEFLFKISEIPLAQWNGAFRLHRPDPSHRAFGYCSYKQDTKKAILGTTILSNGRGHFGPTDRNDQTGQSWPPSKLVQNIPVGPNRNGPYHLVYQPKFREFWVERKVFWA